MTQSDQPKKRKTNAPKKKISSKEKDPKPLTFKEIAFINRTELPPNESETPIGSLAEKLFQQVLEMMVKNFQQFLDAYGGFCSRQEAMKMMGVSSKNTIKMWIEKGLPFYKVENKMVFKKSEINDFMQKYRNMMSVLIVCLTGLPDTGLMMAA